jgi:hypothetical protein
MSRFEEETLLLHNLLQEIDQQGVADCALLDQTTSHVLDRIESWFHSPDAGEHNRDAVVECFSLLQNLTLFLWRSNAGLDENTLKVWKIFLRNLKRFHAYLR